MLSSWVIRPRPNSAPRSRDASGSRIYQLDLKKMKVMPYSDYVRPNFVKKSKRKANDNLGSPSKKISTAASRLDSPEWSEILEEEEDAMEIWNMISLLWAHSWRV